MFYSESKNNSDKVGFHQVKAMRLHQSKYSSLISYFGLTSCPLTCCAMFIVQLDETWSLVLIRN